MNKEERKIYQELGKESYGWSKYGGGMHGLVGDEGDWFCQLCGEEQPEESPKYMLPMDGTKREFLRVCSVCKHVQLKHKLGTYNYTKIIKIVRKEVRYG